MVSRELTAADVIMSPGEMIYFDWYQADPCTQPRAMSGFSPIKKVYSFYPVPDTPEMAAANESMIKGEYVAPSSVEYIYNGGLEECSRRSGLHVD